MKGGKANPRIRAIDAEDYDDYDEEYDQDFDHENWYEEDESTILDPGFAPDAETQA